MHKPHNCAVAIIDALEEALKTAMVANDAGEGYRQAITMLRREENEQNVVDYYDHGYSNPVIAILDVAQSVINKHYIERLNVSRSVESFVHEIGLGIALFGLALCQKNTLDEVCDAMVSGKDFDFTTNKDPRKTRYIELQRQHILQTVSENDTPESQIDISKKDKLH